MPRRIVLNAALLVALATTWPGSAHAQEAAAPADRIKAFAAVRRSCAAETQRFCAALGPAPLSHNVAICLRPYSSSLSLGCRGAVRKAQSRPAP